MTLVQSELKKMYIRVDVQLVNTPGIYHNAEQGLISLSSDGNTWITIADKNLGATQVYNDGDTLSEANCGKYFQWGNNYGFPFTGAVTTSSTQVNAQNYGPGNYYSSSTFIVRSSSPYYWDSSNNNNLWGDITDTNIARQGPAPTGFHVPANNENGALVTAMTALGIDTSNGNYMKTYLKMPFAGRRHYSSADVSNQGTIGNYWSTYAYETHLAYTLSFSSYALGPQELSYRVEGYSIRPFANTPIQPDDSWTVLYQPS